MAAFLIIRHSHNPELQKSARKDAETQSLRKGYCYAAMFFAVPLRLCVFA
jgi:hypothetical protein